MTYAITQPPKVRKQVYIYDRAESNESGFIQKEFERVANHYLRPFTMQWSNPVIKFMRLKKEWEDNTAHLSSVTESAKHPAYQQIIGMGPVAIPLILEEMRRKAGHWFWALKAITGEDPILPEQRGRIKQMTEAWLQWGKKHGYIA